MALTIEIEIPPNTTVALPDSATLQKLVGGHVAISLDNQTGDTVSLAATGTAASFSVDAPVSIADEEEGTIDLEVLAAGSVVFSFDSDEETITVEATAPSPVITSTPIGLARRARLGAMGRLAP